MSKRGAINRSLRKKNKPEIFEFCKDMNFSIRAINGDWHFRVENIIDLYPTRKRFFWLDSKEWGTYKDYDDIGSIMQARKVEA